MSTTWFVLSRIPHPGPGQELDDQALDKQMELKAASAELAEEQDFEQAMNKLTEALSLNCSWNHDTHWFTMNVLQLPQHELWERGIQYSQAECTKNTFPWLVSESINSDQEAIVIGCATALMYGRFEVLLCLHWTRLKWSQTDLGKTSHLHPASVLHAFRSVLQASTIYFR